jgi:hypothetical protein
MITEPDILRLPFTSDLTETGIAWVMRKAANDIKPANKSHYDDLQRGIFQTGVRLALSRYLAAENIPHSTIDIRPLSQPDQYDLAIGRRRCDIRIFPVTHKKSIQHWMHVPERLVSLPVYVLKGELLQEIESQNDLLIFAFVTSLLARQGDMLSKAMKTGQPVYLISTPPSLWSHQNSWRSLGDITVQNESNRIIEIALFGLDATREFQIDMLSLSPHQSVTANRQYYSLTNLHIDELPEGNININSPTLNTSWSVKPLDWVNIWIYGMDIYFAGYLSRSKFIKSASPEPAHTRFPRQFQPASGALCVPVSELLPLGGLFSQAKKWQSRG